MENFVLRFEMFLRSIDVRAVETRACVAKMYCKVVSECRQCLQSRELPFFEDACRCLRHAREVALEIALEATTQKMVMETTTDNLIGGKAWDECLLAAFLCTCFLTAVVADAWHTTVEVSTLDPFARRLDGEIRSGLRWKTIENLIRDVEHAGVSSVEVFLPAFAVVFEIPPENVSASPYVNASRLTRPGVRLLERAQLFDVAREFIEQHLEQLTCETETSHDQLKPKPEEIRTWFKHCVDIEANNALLLRLDEWALLCQLLPLHVSMATGEKAGCPEEHKGAMASWVTSCVLDGDGFAVRCRNAKKNADFEDNVFVCFSHTLEQHYNFYWLDRCFVSRVNPVIALKKLRMYANEGARVRPPLVVERPAGKFVIVTHECTRVNCSDANEAIAFWIDVVRKKMSGLFARHRTVESIAKRIVDATKGVYENSNETRFGGDASDLK